MAQAHRGVTGGIPHTCEVHTALLGSQSCLLPTEKR